MLINIINFNRITVINNNRASLRILFFECNDQGSGLIALQNTEICAIICIKKSYNMH